MSRAQSNQRKLSAQGQASLFQKSTLTGGTVRLKLQLPLAYPTMDMPAVASAFLAAGSGSLEDLQPREGDLVAFPFRLLSAAYLGSGGYHLDFSQPSMLEAALPLFLEPEAEGSRRTGALVVVRDHSENIGDRLGLTSNVRFSDAAPEQGLPHPGIDADLMINWKLAGDVVRLLLHQPPLVEACSISLAFNWEKSHPQLEDWQFWMRLGEEIDGSPVRVVVSEIIAVEHIGLVYAGADPTARRRYQADDGQPVTQNGGLGKSAPAKPVMTASLAAPATEQSDPAAATGGIMLPADSAVWQLLRLHQPDRVQLESRTAELATWAELGRRALDDLRTEVRQLIIRIDGSHEQDFSQGLLKVAEVADEPTLKALRREYSRRLEALVPPVCQVCGSDKVSRRSSREGQVVAPDAEAVKPNPRLYR